MIYTLVFYIFSLLLLSSAVAVVASRNPVHAVLFLVFTFINAACLMVMLGAEFLAMVLIIVYVGAVAILFLFVVMMLNLKPGLIAGYIVKHKNLFLLVGIMLLANILLMLYFSLSVQNYVTEIKSPLVHGGLNSNTIQLGKVLYTDYAYLFEISGLILFVASIAAIFLVHSVKKSDNLKVYKDKDQLSRNKANSLRLTYIKSGRGIDDYSRS